METNQKAGFGHYLVKTLLTSNGLLEQKGSGWVVTARIASPGIQPNQTFTTEDAAIDAVYQALHTGFDRAQKVA